MAGHRGVLTAVLSVAGLAMTFAGATAARADMGPKPSMTFAFSFARTGQAVASGVLLTCEDANCAKPEPLRRLGPQGFDCQPESCFARAYGFTPFARLDITLSDGRRLKSNVFSTRTMLGKFRVFVGGANLKVQPTW